MSAKKMNSLKTIKPEVPEYYSGQFNLIANGVDLTIVFSTLTPSVSLDPNGNTDVSKTGEEIFSSPLCILKMAPGMAKDLHAVLGRTIQKLESDFGEIKTPSSLANQTK